MEATELMVDDWVYNTHNRKPEQVCEIREHMVMLAYNDLYGYDEIEPIPLTPEILEKNGFVKSVNIRDAPPYDNNIYYSIIQDGNTIFWGWWQPDNVLLIPTYSTGFITLNNTHELQHALKLCRIEKEIIL